jgi:tetratricopeptide (TPR) repeat protein
LSRTLLPNSVNVMVNAKLDEAIANCTQALEIGIGFADACQRLGNLLQGMGYFQDAIAWHTRALQPHPNPVAIYAGFGKLYASQKEWWQAIVAYEHALTLAPENAELHRTLAGMYAQVGERIEEVMYRYQAVSLKPIWANPTNQLSLGNALIEQGKLPEAIECYERAVQLDPAFYSAHYNLGVALTQAKDPAAIAAFNRALEINPDHAESHFAVARLLEDSGDLSTALTHYQRSASLDPNSAAAHYALAEALLKLRHWQAAIAPCQRAIELNPEFAWAHHYLGYALLKQSQWQAATVALHRAIELNPDSPWTYYHLGTAYSHLKQWQAAAIASLQAIWLQPDLAGVYRQLGAALRRQQVSDAVELISAAIAQMPEQQDNERSLQIAEALMGEQQFAGAVVFYRLAVGLRPDRPDVQLEIQQRLDQAIAQQQQLEQTISTHREQIAQQPDQPWSYTHLGNLLADQGDWETAIAYHQTAIVLQGWQAAASRHYRFTHDWFTHNLPVWRSVLQPFAHYPGVRALEIGSFEGMSACWILDHILTHPTASLTCIDRYFQEAFDSNVAQTGAIQTGGDRLLQLCGDSHELLATLDPNFYDLIYIDGCHLAPHVQQDAILSWRLLKPGGLLIFDDYDWTDPAHPGQETRIGIDAFMRSIPEQAIVVHHGYQLIIRKVSSVGTEFTVESTEFEPMRHLELAVADS